jgi:flagellin-like protein
MKTDNSMRRSDKRGLSPVIASVLMIMLVLVLAAMIFLWARGFISEQLEKFGKPVEELCESVDFRVEKIGNELEILNRGNIDIWYLDVKMFKDGDSEISKFDFAVDAGKAVKKYVTLVMEDGSNPDETIVYPAILGNVKGGSSNKAFTCNDYGVTL